MKFVDEEVDLDQIGRQIGMVTDAQEHALTAALVTAFDLRV